jgi:succinyl-CoA synthetase beta subunit
VKIHEYQAAGILADHGVPVPRGHVAEAEDALATTISQVRDDFDTDGVVIKAQIHAGGRGKGGGVKFCPDPEQALTTAQEILGMQLVTPQTGAEGQLVRKVYITEAIDIDSEFYLAVTLDRSREMIVLIASTEGGVDIETVAEETPEKISKVWVDPVYGLQAFHARQLAYALGFTGDTFKQACKVIASVYKTFVSTDASLVEINPLVRTGDGSLIALDAKLSFDDSALYRQKAVAGMRDEAEEDPTEVEASRFDLNYIKLEGNVGCMVNGAGLAMATMDIIKLKGGEPANFLDVGGAANVETVKNGFRIILSDDSVKAVLINIFGGIVRCDRVANGIVAAVRELSLSVPVVVRLAGTNAEEAKAILAESGVSIIPADSLDDAAAKVVAAATA